MTTSLNQKPPLGFGWTASVKNNRSTSKSLPQTKIKSGDPAVYDHGRVIGYIRGNVLHRKMQGSKHILKSPPSIAIGVEALKQAIYHGVESVWIQDTESGLEYRCNIWLFNEKAISIDRGYGEQQALPLEHWEIADPKHPEKQLSLLEVQT
jgi:hypothetical protein